MTPQAMHHPSAAGGWSATPQSAGGYAGGAGNFVPGSAGGLGQQQQGGAGAHHQSQASAGFGRGAGGFGGYQG
jgi:hypothetical protein